MMTTDLTATDDPDIRSTRVLLLRHAETSAPERFHGAESDVGLGSAGFEQAKAVAQRLAKLRPHALYCSGLRRARETAIAIGRACGLETLIDDELHERRMGPMSGVLRAEFWSVYEGTKRRWESGELDDKHPGGESFAEIRDRVLPRFLAIAHRHEGQTIVIVAHGVVNRVLLISLLDEYTPADFGRIPIPFVMVNDLRWDGKRWTQVEFDANRLPDPSDPLRW